MQTQDGVHRVIQNGQPMPKRNSFEIVQRQSIELPQNPIKTSQYMYPQTVYESHPVYSQPIIQHQPQVTYVQPRASQIIIQDNEALYKATFARLNGEIQDLTVKLQGQVNDNNDLRMLNRQQEDQIYQIQAQTNSFREQRNQIEQEFDNYKFRAENQQQKHLNQIAQLVQQNRHDQETHQRELYLKNEQLDKKDSELRFLSGQLHDSKDQLNRAKNEIQLLADDRSRLQAENSSLQGRVQNLQEVLQVKDSEVQSNKVLFQQQTRNQGLELQVKELRSEVLGLTDRNKVIANLQCDNEHLAQQCKGLLAELEEQKFKLQGMDNFQRSNALYEQLYDSVLKDLNATKRSNYSHTKQEKSDRIETILQEIGNNSYH